METSIRPFFLTTVGKKYLMALTGIVWAGFILSHMAGNLLLFVSPDAYNSYGHTITSGAIIYLVELVLISTMIVHIYCALSLTLLNRKSGGPGRYAVSSNGDKATSKISKMMAIQGSIILVFIIMHISTFKYGTYYETTVNNINMRDLHRLIVEVFQQPGYVAWYVVALLLLGFHLSHGMKSVFQSLGLKNSKLEKLIQKIGVLYAIIVAGGFLSQPLYVFFFAK